MQGLILLNNRVAYFKIFGSGINYFELKTWRARVMK